MTHETSAERWVELNEFPGYCISDWGNVLNQATGVQLRPTRNTKGVVIVGIMKNSVQCKRSLALLVARAFLPRPSQETFDTPIHLNGDRTYNHFSNLMWRPLWFARKYMKQFTDDHTTFNAPIEDVETGETYSNSMEAATVNGLLDSEIYMSMMNNRYVWPTGQVFREAINR